jgi:hypothetical protein
MNRENPAFRSATQALQDEDYEKVEELFDIPKAVVNFAEGNISVQDGIVTYKGDEVHNYCVDKILQFMTEGLPHKPLIRFFDKLMANPSRRATHELYKFLEHKAMPITPDGNFLAYKGVNEDYTDWYSKTFSNKVGEVLEMPRNGVCDDADRGCSSGFHAGSLEYAEHYGNGGHLMVVEINPQDVVSVPNDSDCQKLRTCKYKVVDHFKVKLQDTLCEQYYEGEDDEDDESDDSDTYDKGYNACYSNMLDALNDLSSPSKSSTP